MRALAIPLGCLAITLLLVGCDQSINESGITERELSGLYCDAKGEQEQNCKAGDVIITAEGREHLLCDWSWQIIHEPESDDVLCVYRGSVRDGRPASGPE